MPNCKFLVVFTSDPDPKKVTEYSCFAVHRALTLISKDIVSVSELRDGNLLLLVNNETTANKFLDCKQLPALCEMKCTLHKSLTFTKGTIYAPYLKCLNV